MYFHMTLQTEDTTYRSVCFSPEKHQHFFGEIWVVVAAENFKIPTKEKRQNESGRGAYK